MKKFKRSLGTGWGKFITIICSIGTLLGIGALIFGLINTFSTDDEGYREIHPVWHIGAVDVETGKIVESNESLYCEINTEELESVKFTLDFDNNISYDIFSYTTVEDELTFDFSNYYGENYLFIPSDNESVMIRVVITPLVEDEEPVKLNVFNMYKYYNQLTIQVKDLPVEETEEIVLLGSELSLSTLAPSGSTSNQSTWKLTETQGYSVIDLSEYSDFSTITISYTENGIDATDHLYMFIGNDNLVSGESIVFLSEDYKFLSNLDKEFTLDIPNGANYLFVKTNNYNVIETITFNK